jgi:hypothetical protein
MFFILSARFAQRLFSITTDYKMIETSVFYYNFIKMSLHRYIDLRSVNSYDISCIAPDMGM